MYPSRRTLLHSSALLLTGALAGCTGSDDGGSGSGPADEATVDSLPTPTIGPDDAAVTVSVYEDYACGHCRNYVRGTFPQIQEEYIDEGTVQYEHHDFPIPVDERWSWVIASAARAVQDEHGSDAFFEFATNIYEHFGSYSLDAIESVAADVGADAQQIRTAGDELVYRPVLVSDRERGIEAGVEGTPTIFVNGTPTEGYGWNAVSAAIEDADP